MYGSQAFKNVFMHVILILGKYVAKPTMSASVWYILVCGLEGDEVLLETPEHSPFLHQPPQNNIDDF